MEKPDTFHIPSGHVDRLQDVGKLEMRVTKRQIRRLIREETSKVLKEQWGDRAETGSTLIEFAKAYSGLGGAVQEQVDAVVGAYINPGGPDSQEFRETVYDQKPNALDMAMDKLGSLLRSSGSEEGEEILGALEAAKDLFEQGDEEVEADRAAAEGR